MTTSVNDRTAVISTRRDEHCVTLGEVPFDFDEAAGEVSDRHTDESRGVPVADLDGITPVGE